MQITPAGDRALLVELGDVAASELHGAAAAVRAMPDVIAAIVGQRSIYTVHRGTPSVERVGSAIRAPGAASLEGRTRRIPVSFREEYAPDLEELLAHARSSREAFLQRVGQLRLVARFIGFRGGFAYLDGWPPEWSMPRRPTSRPLVARGSFAVAGAVAGFYPMDTPGGWNVLGRTGEPLEHAIEAGDEIVIEPVMTSVPARRAGARAVDPSFPVEIVEGRLSRVVSAPDWSRVGLGIPPGGAFDAIAAKHANRAVGNEPHAPLLECALIGPLLAAGSHRVLSWFGAETAIDVDGKAVDDPRQFEVHAGQRIAIGRMAGGMRGYLAAGTARGEVEPLVREDRLTIRTLSGPHESGIRELLCEVTPQLDRVGIRMRVVSPAGLNGPTTLPSCGMQCGTIQLHPDGTVVAMGPDHPVTGGYLQPMTVISADVWKLAQLVPGDRARFVAQSEPYK